MDRAPTTPLFRGILARHRERMDGVRGDIAYRTTQAVLGSTPDPEAPYTKADRRRALRAIDQAFDEHYGRFPGDARGTIYWITRQDARAAMIAAYRYSIEQLAEGLRRIGR